MADLPIPPGPLNGSSPMTPPQKHLLILLSLNYKDQNAILFLTRKKKGDIPYPNVKLVVFFPDFLAVLYFWRPSAFSVSSTKFVVDLEMVSAWLNQLTVSRVDLA